MLFKLLMGTLQNGSTRLPFVPLMIYRSISKWFRIKLEPPRKSINNA